MILDKILNAEIILEYRYRKIFVRKVITIFSKETFVFDEYTEFYCDRFARYFLTNTFTNETCEIFEYSLPTFLVYDSFVYDIDLFVSYGDTKYFYNKGKLVYTVIGNKDSYIITN